MPVEDDLQHHDLDPTPDKTTNAPLPVLTESGDIAIYNAEPITLNTVAGYTIHLSKTPDGYMVLPEDQDVADVVGLPPEFEDSRAGIMLARILSRSCKVEGLVGTLEQAYRAALAQQETATNG